MLDPNAKKYLISQYLHDYLQFIERDMYGCVPPVQEPETSKDRVRLKKLVERKNFTLKLLDYARSKTNMGRDSTESVQNWADNIDTWLKDARESLALRKTDSVEFCKIIERRIAHFNSRVEKKKDKIVLSDDDKKILYMDFLRAEIQALEVYKAASVGELSSFNSLKESVSADLDQCAILGMTFSKVIKEYIEYYENAKHNVKVGTLKDMKVECEMLLDIIGDININKVNTMGTLTKLKQILLKYPRNKKQKYGDKPIHDILRTQTNYAIISNKTANEPLKRIVNIIDYAIKSDYVLSANKYNNELFDVDKTNKPRKSYDKNDIEKLVDAICTKPLWTKKPSKDDRFWVILIALLHGFRLGNIVNITKKHIIQDENGWHCFDLRLFQEEELLKTVNASMLVPIHGYLLLLGFMTWVESSKNVRLFNDTPKSFSAWYIQM